MILCISCELNLVRCGGGSSIIVLAAMALFEKIKSKGSKYLCLSSNPTSYIFFVQQLKFHGSKKYENFTVCYLEYLDSAVIFLGPDLFSKYANLFRLVTFAFFISPVVVV